MNPARLSGPVYAFTQEESQKANNEWGMNCGPSALAMMLSLKPDDVRTHIPDFDQRRYTSPTMMKAALASLGVPFREAMGGELVAVINELNAPVFPAEFIPAKRKEAFPTYGLARIQWEGPWMAEGVPIRARYRYSHWVGSFDDGSMLWIFDVNAGWSTYAHWRDRTIPWLIESIKRANGFWYLTHRWQLLFPSRQTASS